MKDMKKHFYNIIRICIYTVKYILAILLFILAFIFYLWTLELENPIEVDNTELEDNHFKENNSKSSEDTKSNSYEESDLSDDTNSTYENNYSVYTEKESNTPIQLTDNEDKSTPIEGVRDVDEVLSHVDSDYVKICNMEAYIKNNFGGDNIEILDNDKSELDINLVLQIVKEFCNNPYTNEEDERARLRRILDNYEVETVEYKNGSDDGWETDSEYESAYEKLVREIRSNSNITICSASSDENKSTNEPYIAYSSSTEGVNKVDTDDLEKPVTTEEYKPKRIVIITKMSKEGEYPPLPSWFIETTSNPVNEEERVTQENDAKIKKKWTSKFPFLPEHHEQIEQARKNKKLEKENLTDIYEEESLHLDKLFDDEESENDNKTN